MSYSNKNDPNNPFMWAKFPRPSIFVNDNYFRAKGPDGKSTAQIATDVIDKRREADPMLGTIKGIGRASTLKKEEERMLAYRQFGVYSRAQTSIKQPNKHEK